MLIAPAPSPRRAARRGLHTWGRSWNSSLHTGQGCMESPCDMDRCLTLSHSSDESGGGGGSNRPSFCAEVRTTGVRMWVTVRCCSWMMPVALSSVPARSTASCWRFRGTREAVCPARWWRWRPLRARPCDPALVPGPGVQTQRSPRPHLLKILSVSNVPFKQFLAPRRLQKLKHCRVSSPGFPKAGTQGRLGDQRRPSAARLLLFGPCSGLAQRPPSDPDARPHSGPHSAVTSSSSPPVRGGSSVFTCFSGLDAFG